MRRVSVVLVAVSAVGLAACQQAAPDRTAEAVGPAVAPPSTTLSRADSHPTPPEEPVPAPAEMPPPAAPHRPPSSPAVEAAPPKLPAAAVPPPPPQPALTSRPAPEPRILPAGTALPLVLQTAVASNTSQVGDRVVAALAEDVSVQGRVVLAAGTEVAGRVTVAMQSGRVKGRARLAMVFDEVHDGGSSYPIDATPVDVTAESSKSQDTKIAGGAAAAGAIIGAIAGGGKGALKGGAIGGAAGGAAVLATRGQEVVLESGTELEVTVNQKAQID